VAEFWETVSKEWKSHCSLVWFVHCWPQIARRRWWEMKDEKDEEFDFIHILVDVFKTSAVCCAIFFLSLTVPEPLSSAMTLTLPEGLWTPEVDRRAKTSDGQKQHFCQLSERQTEHNGKNGSKSWNCHWPCGEIMCFSRVQKSMSRLKFVKLKSTVNKDLCRRETSLVHQS
jgi:hypothetical protein